MKTAFGDTNVNMRLKTLMSTSADAGMMGGGCHINQKKSKKMSKRAEELYPFVLYKVGGWNDIEKVKEENSIRNLERLAYNRAIEDIKELIQSRIKSISANRERGYWLDAASELQDIIDIIDDE